MTQAVEIAGAPNTDMPGLEKPEKVSFTAVNFFRSHWFSLLGGTAVLAASVTWILPAAASLMQITLSPPLIKSLLGTLVVGAAFLGLRMKKELVYEISLLYTIQGSKAWWNKINDNIVLGALPLEHQRDKLKALGITHVISTLEPFELKLGLVRPVQPEQWKESGITHKHIEAVDFLGMPADQIHKAVEFMHDQIQKESSYKFYVHCKAGRGRSATVVIAYLLKYGSLKSATKEEAYAFVKNLRPQINLNENQMDAIQKYLNNYRNIS